MERIGVGGLMHESNTFASGRTTVADFETGGLEQGQGIRDRWGDAHHEVGGALEAIDEAGALAVPTLMGWATPAGPLDAPTFDALLARLLSRIEQSAPFAGFVLCLHGAMVADGVDDADGRIASEVRRQLGRDVALVVTLDFHANVSPRLVTAADAVLAYRTYPHIDQRERGAKAARLAIRAVRGEIRPFTVLRRPLLLVPLLRQDTAHGRFANLMRSALACERSSGILDVSLLGGFPYADVEAAGVSCLVVADGEIAQAESLADRLALEVWQARGELTVAPLLPREAVRQALVGARRPALLVDLGDNVGGGSAADSTVLLHELRKQGATNVLAVLYDPQVAETCHVLGVGATIRCEVGGKHDRHAPGFAVEGVVRSLHDGRYVEREPRHGGIRENDQGATAVIATTDGHTIVVNSLRHPPFSLGQFTSLGIDPAQAHVVIVKAALAYKAAYASLGGTTIEVDTPGLTASDPAGYSYGRVRRPLYPLDRDADWEPSQR